jgi:MFS family permease
MTESEGAAKPAPRQRWLYSTLPGSMAYGPISTIVILYILYLGGNVIDASYAITLGSLVVIPAAYFWGKVIDKFKREKPQIIISYVGIAIFMAAMYFTNAIILVVLFYVLVSFFTSANATPLNMLVMENAPADEWHSEFSRLQLMVSAGSTAGYLFSTFVLGLVEIKYLTILLAVIAIPSIIMSALFISSEPTKIERKAIISNIHVFVTRIFMTPVLFVSKPKISVFKKIFSIGEFRKKKISYLGIIYLGIFVFMLSSGIFNTAYPAGLKNYGLTEFEIFIIITVGIMIQTITFAYSNRFVGRKFSAGMLSNTLLLRSASYLLTGIIFIVAVSRPEFIIFNAILYSLAAGFAYSIYYVISNTMVFKAVGKEHPASKLGIYTAMMNVALLIGALLGGYISYYLGFSVSFFAAGILLLLSIVIFGHAIGGKAVNSA